MRDESNIMKLIHEIREKHYLETKDKLPVELKKEFEKETQDLIAKFNLKWRDFVKQKFK